MSLGTSDEERAEHRGMATLMTLLMEARKTEAQQAAEEAKADSEARIAEAQRDVVTAEAAERANADDNSTQRHLAGVGWKMVRFVLGIIALVVAAVIVFVFVLLFQARPDDAIDIMKSIGLLITGGFGGSGITIMLGQLKGRQS